MQFRIDIAIYRVSFYFYIGENEMNEYCKDLEEDDTFLDNSDGMFCDNCIWLREGNDVFLSVHEITHGIDVLMDEHGLPNDTEVRAYLMGYVMQEYLTQLNIDRESYEI